MGCCVAHPKGKVVILQGASKKNADFRELYTVGEMLGEGTFGMVFDCTKKNDPTDKATYAVKMLEHQSSWWGRHSKAASDQWELLAQEFKMMKQMDHENVIRLHDVFVDRDFLYFVMDKYVNSLVAVGLPLLQKGRSVMPYCVIGEISRQMLAAIVYLHALNIVHRDVKADNYLVDAETFKCKKFKVVLTDLGTARHLEDGVFLKEMLGTMQYWAPEVIARCYTHKVDCWAVGVVLWCMLTLKFPFNTAQEAYVKQPQFRKDKMTHDQFDLICMLLDKNPTHRISAKLAIEHKFILNSYEKHKQMVLGQQMVEEGNEQTKAWSEESSDDAEGMSFGGNKKSIDKDVTERRLKGMNDARVRFENGETEALSFEVKIQDTSNQTVDAGDGNDVVAIDKQRAGESKQYSWWAESRCKVKGVPDIDTNCTLKKESAPDEDPSYEQAGDIALTEPANVEELTDQLRTFGMDTSVFGVGEVKPLDHLYRELENNECRMVLRGDVVIRVVDLLALRIKSPSGKMLIEAEKNYADGRTKVINRLPAKMRTAGGSGVQRALAELKTCLQTELGTTPDVVVVEQRTQHDNTSYVQDSKSYPSLTTVYRKTFFDGAPNMEANAEELKKLGLPAEEPFSVPGENGASTTFKWFTEDELKVEKIEVSFPRKTLDELRHLRPLKNGNWTEAKLTAILQQHKIDTSAFGVGAARSIKQFVQECNTGETHLLSDGNKLRRHLDILVVKIKNPIGAYLIETGHAFGKGQTRAKNAFPATKVRPFEDKVWAVRRLLSEVDIPYASSKIMFGPVRVESQESPSYPGVITVYVKQVVEVQLMEIDVANLDGVDMGRDKWFAQKIETKISLDIKTPRPNEDAVQGG
jgi:serine/threonine protein kinase